MKIPAINNTRLGIVTVILGLIVAVISWSSSPKKNKFHLHGLEREGRVLSGNQSPTPSLRIFTNASSDSIDMQVVEVTVTPEEFEKAPVGTHLSLLVLPGNPPRAHLNTPAKSAPSPTGLVIASFFTCIGIFFLWLDFPKNKHAKTKLPKPPKKTTKSPPPAPLLTMEKIPFKDPTLYDGIFEFSYAEEKTSIEMPDGTSLRINQYCSLPKLTQVLTDRDLVKVLRTAKSTWKIPRITGGRKILVQLIKNRKVTKADQFFINGEHLGLLFRDEVDHGRWHAWVRGLWKISPLSKLFADLVSRDAARSRDAANKVLHHNEIQLLTALAPDADLIRDAAKHTPRDRQRDDNRRAITLAADMVEALGEGNCQCHIYSGNPDFSPAQLVKKEKFTKVTPDEVGYIQMADINHVACCQCNREYKVTGKIGSHIPNFKWEPKPAGFAGPASPLENS